MIEQTTIDRVMAAADIVDVVQDFVALRKTGASYKGLCPFHEDRTPSFIVSPAKGLCKCFACGAGGNVVKFVQLHEQMSYPEAIKWLAKKYGIEVEEAGRTDEQKERSQERESMFVVNEWACNFFTSMLHDDPDGVAIGMTYFRGRGFRDDTIRRFALGFCPDRRDAMSAAAIKAGYEERWLVNDAESRRGVGLSFKNEKGGLTDRYRGRVIFPIMGVSGRVVGFGGRVLAKATKGVSQKYVNSPESLIYSKSRELYGLYQAKQAIVKQGCCYLVEGYTDVISMSQSGVENVVASSGTALTEGQIALLHRFTSNVTMLFDGDEAGIHAALRGTDLLLAQGLNIKVLLLPDGEDPDSFARTHRAEEFRQYITDHEEDFISFKTKILLKNCQNDPVKKAEVVTDIVASISVIPNDILRQTYAHECADRLRMPENVIVKAIADRRAKTLLPANGGQRPDGQQSASGGAGANAGLDGGSGGAERELPPEFDPETGEPILPPPPRLEIREELNLAKALIRFGGYDIELYEGERMPVATYIAQELAADEIVLQMPLCQKVLEMAAEIAASETLEPQVWQARFTMNEDEEMAALAATATDDKYQLSQHQQKVYVKPEMRLGEIIPRLLYDMKYKLISETVDNLQQQLRDPAIMNDMARMAKIMQDYSDVSEMQREIGKLLGGRVVKKY